MTVTLIMKLLRRNHREAALLVPYDIPDNDYVEFVINTTRRTVKKENSPIRQILYTGLSKDTADRNNLMVSAPTSEGKTCPVIEMLQFFPEEDVLYIGKMSTMSLVDKKVFLWIVTISQ